MTDILDCIQVLGRTAGLFAAWVAAAGMMWAYDALKARSKDSANDQVELLAPEKKL